MKAPGWQGSVPVFFIAGTFVGPDLFRCGFWQASTVELALGRQVFSNHSKRAVEGELLSET